MMKRVLIGTIVALFMWTYGMGGTSAMEQVSNAITRGDARPPEDVYRGELVAFPGPWSFQIGKSGIILVSDRELEALTDPDRKLNLSLTFEKREESLRQICERAQAAGQRTLILAFDQFFTQYRPGQAGPRKLTPDMDAYVRLIARISRFAAQYGLGLELSLLSPLEIGPGYNRQTGESGIWMHYRKGVRNPQTGAYSVELWRQHRWTNNKGPIEVKDAGVRVFAFHEEPIPGTTYRVVKPEGIVEITDTAHVERLGPTIGSVQAERIRVYGKGRTDLGPLDRVLVVQQYRTPEMDYFSDKALPFLKSLVDKYAAAGVKLNALYSDEMHIQQDWDYFHHHDHGEFALRYVSPGLAKEYARRYGAEYADFAKYLVYFCYGQEDWANDLSAREGASDVFGATPEEIQRTALFRARYYHLLQNGVVDLFTQAKHYAERVMGHRLEARAHATWAESPTIDYWRTGSQPMFRSAYEYTSNFVWSNTVQQAASACYDYFKWGDFLTGNGNDHAEGGYADRDYFALALACSTGILNEVPLSYAAHWGMPDAISRRRMALVNTYGDAGSPLFGMVEGMEHRDTTVLMLYPLDLTAVEERFGSWMTQYGYANYITQEKLLERGVVHDGAIEVAGRRFTTLVSLFEPFPSHRLLQMMRDLVQSGGTVIWSGPPPLLAWEGDAILPEWQDLFGVRYQPLREGGIRAPGKEVVFHGALASVPTQVILTDFLVDRIYPVTPQISTEVAATIADETVGTLHTVAHGGKAVYLGFRPRDDQSRSLGYETRTWFEVLASLGAYPGTGVFPGVNDNPDYLSRTTHYLCCRFPNGTVAIAPHFRSVEEGWPGGFARNRKQDEEIVKRLKLPSEHISLTDFRVNGHVVTYEGDEAVAFRVDESRNLIAFSGSRSHHILIDGRDTAFADGNLSSVAWAPVPQECRVPGGAVMRVIAYGSGTLRIPAAGLPQAVRVYAEGPKPGSKGAEVPCHLADGTLQISVAGGTSGRWLYVVPVEAAH